MSFTTLEQFFRDYRIKNGMVPSEAIFNRGPMRLKREIRELKSILDIITGVALPEWSSTTRYEVDEYISYNNKIYKSLADGNLNYIPSETPAFWVEVNMSTIGGGSTDMSEYVPWTSVSNSAGKIPVYTADGHLKLPDGTEIWREE